MTANFISSFQLYKYLKRAFKIIPANRFTMSQPVTLDKYEFKQVFDQIDWVISDCDGVLWVEKNLIKGTPQLFNKLRSMGKKIIFATNNDTKSREDVLTKLIDFGFQASLNEIMTTSYSIPVYLKSQQLDGSIYCFGSTVLRREIEKFGFKVVPSSSSNEDANDAKLIRDDGINYGQISIDPNINAVVIGFDYKLDSIKLIKACTYATKVNPDLVLCTSMDYTFPAPNGLMVPGTGMYVELIEKVVNRKIVAVGKPETFFFDCIKTIHPTLDPSRTIMFGDRCDTDIAFGNKNNLKYSLLVGTGVNNLVDVEKFSSQGLDHLVPSHYISSLANLNEYFDA